MKLFKTLRGFLAGEETDEPLYFAYSASLRIWGEALDLDDISRQLGVQPTMVRRRGERARPGSPVSKDDAWHFTVSLPEERPLHEHIDELWRTIRSAKAFLKELKKSVRVDVFLGYRSNCDHAGVQVPWTSLEMFVELEIPFGISVIVA